MHWVSIHSPIDLIVKITYQAVLKMVKKMLVSTQRKLKIGCLDRNFLKFSLSLARYYFEGVITRIK